MSWSSRQKRLKDMMGVNSNLCFSAFVLITENNVTNRGCIPDEEFYRLERLHGLCLEKGENYGLPKQKLGKFEHHGGYIFHASNGDKLIEKVTLQPLYTVTGYDMSDFHIDRGSASLDMYFIKSLYMPKILERFAEDFEYCDEDDFFYEADDFSIQFSYIVQQYDPSFCHPNDLGTLQPLIMPNGIVIDPPIETISSLNELRTNKLRDRSFTFY